MFDIFDIDRREGLGLRNDRTVPGTELSLGIARFVARPKRDMVRL